VAVRRTAGWGEFAQRFVDSCQHAVQISVDLIVPEPKHAKSVSFKVAIALSVFDDMRIKAVLASIDLHHQAMPHANKVHDVSFTRRLPTKVISAFPPRPQMNPEFHLLARQRLA